MSKEEFSELDRLVSALSIIYTVDANKTTRDEAQKKSGNKLEDENHIRHFSKGCKNSTKMKH
ncbi:unnamed protein product [Pneumocystis jirovecii]|uniref:Uncharacterized protein n=1 Tax=Pneumocystis jirovecii TaxID=42068 RepID=L0PAH3_PNEJI|nr:unnamed protein product [Pneumocystis jirovecii]